MEKHLEVIDGQEVVVKVYATRAQPKKQTVCLPFTRRRAIAKNRKKKRTQKLHK